MARLFINSVPQQRQTWRYATLCDLASGCSLHHSILQASEQNRRARFPGICLIALPHCWQKEGGEVLVGCRLHPLLTELLGRPVSAAMVLYPFPACCRRVMVSICLFVI